MEPNPSGRINAAERKLNATIEGLGGAPPAAMIAKKWGDNVVAYGAFVPSVRVAGLERAARLAGEAFGHEELAPVARRRDMAVLQSWAVWLLAAVVAIVGLAALSLR